MLKKILISGVVITGFFLNAAVANAQEDFFIKKEVLSKQLIWADEETKMLPCADVPSENIQEEQVTCENNEEVQLPCSDEYYLPCASEKEPCAKTTSCQKKCPQNKEILQQLEEKLSLNEEQKIFLAEIKKATCEKVKPLMIQLNDKKAEVATLQLTKMSHVEIEKRTVIMNKEIAKLQKEIKEVKANAEAQFKKQLTFKQKRLYSIWKKEFKMNVPCADVCNGFCSCQAPQDCPCCQKCPLKTEECPCEQCECNEDNNCGCLDK